MSLSVRTISSASCSVEDAYKRASAEVEPVFVPAKIYTDDRGWSLMNQMQGVMRPEGQLNYSVQYPGVIKAWHRHAKQTDFWMCIQGHMKMGVYRDDGAAWMLVSGEKNAGVVIVPPTLWHGAATVGPTSAGLLYFVTHAYDPQAPDEERMPFDEVEGFNWGVECR